MPKRQSTLSRLTSHTLQQKTIVHVIISRWNTRRGTSSGSPPSSGVPSAIIILYYADGTPEDGGEPEEVPLPAGAVGGVTVG